MPHWQPHSTRTERHSGTVSVSGRLWHPAEKKEVIPTFIIIIFYVKYLTKWWYWRIPVQWWCRQTVGLGKLHGSEPTWICRCNLQFRELCYQPINAELPLASVASPASLLSDQVLQETLSSRWTLSKAPAAWPCGLLLGMMEELLLVSFFLCLAPALMKLQHWYGKIQCPI